VVASLQLFAYRSFLSQRRLCFFRAVENTFEYRGFMGIAFCSTYKKSITGYLLIDGQWG